MSLILSGTDGVSDVDGTAATPAIRGTDTNTGIFFPAADTIAFAEGGVESARFDSAGNLGIGTSSPGERLDVVGTARVVRSTGATNTGDQNAVVLGATTTGAYAASYGAGLQFQVTNSGGGYSGGRIVSRLGADNFTANLVFQARNYGYADSMTLDSSGNLGIGTSSPSAKLQAVSGDNLESTAIGLFTANNGSQSVRIGYNGIYQTAAQALKFGTNNAEQMQLSSAGNLGLGVTPSAWGGLRALQIANASWFGLGNSAYSAVNAYYDGSIYRYISTGFACRTITENGQFQWFTAPSGTAGNAISFTQAMTLDASGNLGIGATSPSALGLQVSKGSGVAAGLLLSNANNNWSISCGASTNALIFTDNQFAERARITSGGDLLVGTTSAFGKFTVNGGKTVINSTDGSSAQVQIGNPTSNGEASLAFISGVTQYGINPASTNGNQYVWVVGANVYSIGGNSWGISNSAASNFVARINWNSTSWIFSSDERLKNVEGRVENALDKVAVLRPVYFTWKNDEAKERKVGLLAQDVLQVLPEAVTVPEQETREDGSQNYLGLGMSDLVPLLTAAIQEQQAIIQTLTTRIAALEAK